MVAIADFYPFLADALQTMVPPAARLAAAALALANLAAHLAAALRLPDSTARRLLLAQGACRGAYWAWSAVAGPRPPPAALSRVSLWLSSASRWSTRLALHARCAGGAASAVARRALGSALLGGALTLGAATAPQATPLDLLVALLVPVATLSPPLWQVDALVRGVVGLEVCLVAAFCVAATPRSTLPLAAAGDVLMFFSQWGAARACAAA